MVQAESSRRPLLTRRHRLQEPSWVHEAFASTLFAVRRFFLAYLSPPRPSWLAVHRIGDERDPATGKYHTSLYFAHPWYVKPTFAARWGPTAMAKRILGGAVPSVDPKYIPEGYEVSEVGPERLSGKGEEEMEVTRAWLRDRRGLGGCPMAL